MSIKDFIKAKLFGFPFFWNVNSNKSFKVDCRQEGKVSEFARDNNSHGNISNNQQINYTPVMTGMLTQHRSRFKTEGLDGTIGTGDCFQNKNHVADGNNINLKNLFSGVSHGQIQDIFYKKHIEREYPEGENGGFVLREDVEYTKSPEKRSIFMKQETIRRSYKSLNEKSTLCRTNSINGTVPATRSGVNNASISQKQGDKKKIGMVSKFITREYNTPGGGKVSEAMRISSPDPNSSMTESLKVSRAPIRTRKKCM